MAESVPGADTTYTMSIYVREGTSNDACLAHFDGSTSVALEFDFTTEAITEIGTPTATGFEAYPGGWYRLWMTNLVQSTDGNNIWKFLVCNESGWATSDVGEYTDAYGAQLEASEFPSSYVHNSDATENTRNASSLNDMHYENDLGLTAKTNEMTDVFEWIAPGDYDVIDADQTLWLKHADANNQQYVHFDHANDRFEYTSIIDGNTVTLTDANHTFSAGDSVFIVTRKDTTGVDMWITSTSVAQTTVTDVTANAQANFASSLINVDIGERDTTDPLQGGLIRGFAFYDYELTDAEAAALTSSAFDDTMNCPVVKSMFKEVVSSPIRTPIGS
jgi:hypothetical protein